MQVNFDGHDVTSPYDGVPRTMLHVHTDLGSGGSVSFGVSVLLSKPFKFCFSVAVTVHA